MNEKTARGIRSLIDRRDVTLDELADYIGVSRSRVSQFLATKSGTSGEQYLPAIADFFGVTVEALDGDGYDSKTLPPELSAEAQRHGRGLNEEEQMAVEVALSVVLHGTKEGTRARRVLESTLCKLTAGHDNTADHRRLRQALFREMEDVVMRAGQMIETESTREAVKKRADDAARLSADHTRDTRRRDAQGELQMMKRAEYDAAVLGHPAQIPPGVGHQAQRLAQAIACGQVVVVD